MDGNSFRDQVANVVKARYGSATTERKVGGKDADIFFSIKYPGGDPLKIAVECKAWKKPLTSKDITGIYSEYIPAFEAREVDSLWIISMLPVRGEQDETIRAFGFKLRFFTLASLVSELIDFTPYLNHLVFDFEKDGLAKYYINPRTENGDDLHKDIVIPWLSKPKASPLAVIAEYGAGKTSYAKFLSSFLAAQSLTDATCPIPILLQLGDLTRQQSIRGLINSLFSDEFGIEGYKYSLFLTLMEQGRFVVILDGFDEMKHAMRRRDIEKNFESIREFIEGKKSKYILLGRPSPFLSLEDEFPLRAVTPIGSQLVSHPTHEGFSVVGLADFTNTEVELFLRGFLTNYPSDCQVDPASVDRRIAEIRSKGLMETARRPVHARMLGALAASPSWQVSASTEYDLFNHFVSAFLRREVFEKAAREPVPEAERHDFMQRIAWWLWSQKKAISFTADQVPEYLIETTRKYFDDEDTEEVILREMLTGSMLGRRLATELIVEKDAYSFYFPHRSFWEFFVAEYVASIKFHETDFLKLTKGTSQQIITFLRERDERSFAGRLLAAYKKYSNRVDSQFLSQLSKAIRWDTDNIVELSTPQGLQFGPVLCLAAATGEISGSTFSGYLKALTHWARGHYNPEIFEAVVMYGNIFYSCATDLTDEATVSVATLNMEFFCRCIKDINLEAPLQGTGNKTSVAASKGVANSKYYFFATCVEYEKKDERIEVKFDTQRVAKLLHMSAPVEVNIIWDQYFRRDYLTVWADEMLNNTALSSDDVKLLQKVFELPKPSLLRTISLE